MNQPNHPTQPNIPPEHHLPHWVSILIIVILGLFVIGVVGYAAYQYFAVEPTPPTPQPLLQLPQPTNPFANWQTYRNEEYGFEVRYPEDWNIIQLTDYLVVIKGDNKFSLDISMPPLGRGHCLENEKEIVLNNNIPAKQYSCLREEAGEIIVVYNRQLPVVKEDGLFIFSYLGEIQTTDFWYLFNQILSTFKFID